MYSLTFSRKTIKDLLAYADGIGGWGSPKGRQFYGAVLMPYSGYFTSKLNGEAPKIVCPYQVNDIIAIQEQWARSATGYVYKIQPDSYNPAGHEDNPIYNKPDLTGYDFRPATTMPVEAVRMFGRITAVTPWPLTQDIARYYLSPWALDVDTSDNVNVEGKGPGTTDFLSPGVGKTIDYCDNGNKLLSTIRKIRNKQVLQKSGQPVIAGWNKLPTVTSYMYYYMNIPAKYFKTMGYYYKPPYGTLDSGNEYHVPRTLIAQANRSAPADLWYHPYKSDGTVDTDHLDRASSGWTYYESTEIHNEYPRIGEYTYDGTTVYVHLQLDNRGFPVPVYATYKSNRVDPNKNIYVWLITGYLCDRDGNTTGKLF